MAVLVHEPGFSIVESSWSGSVVVTIGATAVTVTGETDSPASIWIRLVEQCTLTHGGSWIGWSEHGVLYIQSSLSFTLTSSGSVQTRLNLPASASGVVVNGSGVQVGGYYPKGLGWKGYDRKKEDGAAAADGSAATPQIWKSKSATATFLDLWSFIYDWHDDLIPAGDLITVDLWMGGRAFGRYIVENGSTRRLSSVIDYAELELSLRGVS